jgi:hypothetical protein
MSCKNNTFGGKRVAKAREDARMAAAAERENELIMQVADDPREFQLFLHLHSPAATAGSSSSPHPRAFHAAAEEEEEDRLLLLLDGVKMRHPRKSLAVAVRRTSFSTSDLSRAAAVDDPMQQMSCDGLTRLRADMSVIERKIRQINERNMVSGSGGGEEEVFQERRHQDFERQFQTVRNRRRECIFAALWRSFLEKLRFVFCLSCGS